MTRRITTTLVAIAVGMSGALAVVPSSASAAPAAAPSAAPAAVQLAPAAKKRKPKPKPAAISPSNPYTPRTGPIINNPLSKARKHVVVDHLLKTMRSVPNGGYLRISDWNIDSQRFVDVATAAHRRGVSVQILMSKGVADRQNPRTGTFAKLKRNLAVGSAARPPVERSWIRGCHRACRGPFGVNHAKFLVASQTGMGAQITGRDVSMISSANVTGAAGINQWNDIYTVANSAKTADFFYRLFGEMAPDRNVQGRVYRVQNDTGIPWLAQIWANPHRRGDADPSLQLLRAVRCTGVTGGAGVRGRTAIRIAHTAITGPRGMAIARQLKTLRGQGCNIKVVFALMDVEIRNMFASKRNGGAILNRQLVRDTNRDGFYDRYLHTKFFTITGNVAGYGSNARIVRTGSENWTSKSFLSDEVGFNITRPKDEVFYRQWIDGAFAIANKGFTRKPPPNTRMLDPFRYVDIPG
jgi:hypothetical protein